MDNSKKQWHVVSNSGPATSAGIKDAHESCLNQLIGHLMTVNVTLEIATAAVDAGVAIVTLIGSRTDK